MITDENQFSNPTMNPNPIVPGPVTPALQLNRRRFLQASVLTAVSAPFYGALVTPGAQGQFVPASEKIQRDRQIISEG